MNDRLQLLVGTWESGDADSRGALEISVARRGLKVRAYDKYDGEEFIVSKTRVNDESLSFETFTRSAKWRTRNSLKPISKTRLIQELTIWEGWRRVRANLADQDIQSPKKEPQRPNIQKNDKLQLLAGRWEVAEDDSMVAFEISKTRLRLTVRAFNKYDGEEFVVSKTRVRDGILSFEIFVPSSKSHSRHSLKPISRTKLMQELTIWCLWRKVRSNPSDQDKQPPGKELKREKIQRKGSKAE